MKRFLDSVAYYCLLGNTQDIETDYKKVMHAKREIPASSCPSFVENMLYSTNGLTGQVEQEERDRFRVMTDLLDEPAEKYETNKPKRVHTETKFEKRRRIGIHGGDWCRVDTDGEFDYSGHRYRIDVDAEQYKPTETEFGLLYDMDRILACGDRFFDMNYDEVSVRPLTATTGG